MTRNQIFTVLELVNDGVRVTLGEYYNDSICLFDLIERPCDGILHGEIIDDQMVCETIKSIRDEINSKYDLILEEVVLALPSDKLKISSFSSSSPVTSKNLLISEQDISDSYKVATKIRHDEDEKSVRVIPMEYQLDTGEKMEFAPVRYRSATFKTVFNDLIIPLATFDKYSEILNRCNLRIADYYLDVESLYAGTIEEGDTNCAIVSLNRFSTSITFFKRGKLLANYSLDHGSSLVEQELINRFDVKKEDINRVMYILGNASLEASSKRAIYRNENYKDYKYLDQYSVDEVISESYTQTFQELISLCKDKIDASVFDIYVTGYAAQIRNMASLFTKISGSPTQVAIPKYLGLASSKYTTTLGIIKLNLKKLISSKQKVELNRMDENSNSKFDQFVLDEDELN